jgi:hypothetical protein
MPMERGEDEGDDGVKIKWPLAGLNSFETHGFDADSLRLLQIRSCFKFHADTINKNACISLLIIGMLIILAKYPRVAADSLLFFPFSFHSFFSIVCYVIVHKAKNI